jgi:hypothetical protein
MQHVHPKTQSPEWLATELLKRTDLSTGDVCMFHYPMDFFPNMQVHDMESAFEMIIEGQLTNPRNNHGSDENADNAINNNVLAPVPAPAYMSNASLEARNQITRIQFSWYQFREFPREALGRTYANLQHLDIRQNASLTCIDSLIAQLPQLASLNLSDCVNLRTLAPLARARDTLGGDDAIYRRPLNLRHLWVRGCNLSFMTEDEWANVFDALAESSGPLERLTLSRNNMNYLHGNIGKSKSLTYLFVEDNDTTSGATKTDDGFEIPNALGDLTSLRFISLCGNNVTSLPRTMGRLHESCDVYLHRNPNLSYPPPAYQRSITAMRNFFHRERMKLLRGSILFMPHFKRARRRANERLYKPGGWGYMVCKERFEESVRRTSIALMSE